MKLIEAGSYYSYLPEGCRLCRKGSKLVLFITGICNNSCFYCPVSRNRLGKDVIFANEREVKRKEDFIAEVEAMDAEGVGITGGEPMFRLERLIEFVNLSKALDLHVHVYTSVPVREDVLRKIKVDEIRFHPPELKEVEKYAEPIKDAKKLGIDAGFEIPAFFFEEKIVEIANELDAFLNLNQLEASETNWLELERRGFLIRDYYVEVDEIVRLYERVNKFHYCSARFKDSVQFRRRLIRMAKKLPDFYLKTDDGTVLCLRIEGDLEKAERLLRSEGIEFQRFEDCIETSPRIRKKLKDLLKAEGLRLALVERYPTFDRTVVELVWL
uniref:Radical SAM protein n=1 Tax=Archaeoglobus fulgidus TaxID=2234 RepID=A0A7J2THK8_ARCFL